MVIMTKQAVLFMDHGERFRAPNGYLGTCPDWVAETRQFREMMADGVIVATESTSDKAMDKAMDKAAKKSKKPKEAPEAQDQEITESTSDKAAEE